MLFAVAAFTSPLLVCAVQVILSLFMVTFIAVMRPFKKKINLVQLMIYEVIVLIMNILILAMTHMTVKNSSNTNMIILLGDLVILGNDILNIVALFFLVIRCLDEGSKIWADAKRKSFAGPQEKTGMIQLLGIFMQQSNMGFEEFIDDYVTPSSSLSSSNQEFNKLKSLKLAKNGEGLDSAKRNLNFGSSQLMQNDSEKGPQQNDTPQEIKLIDQNDKDKDLSQISKAPSVLGNETFKKNDQTNLTEEAIIRKDSLMSPNLFDQPTSEINLLQGSPTATSPKKKFGRLNSSRIISSQRC